MDKTAVGFEKHLKEFSTMNEISREQYVWQVSKFLREYPKFLKNHDENSIRKFLVAGKRSYVRRYALKKYLSFLKLDKMNDSLANAYKEVKLKDRRYPRLLSFRDIKLLIENIKHPELALLLKLLYDTDCRISAMLNLKWINVKTDDADKVYLDLREKREKMVRRYIEPVLVDELLLGRGRNTDYVFRVHVKNRWETWRESYYRLYDQLKSESRKILGLGFGISFHWIRTSRLVHYYEKTTDLKKTQAFAGHKNSVTTERYLSDIVFDSRELIGSEKKW